MVAKKTASGNGTKGATAKKKTIVSKQTSAHKRTGNSGAKILLTLAQQHTLGHKICERKTIASMAGYPPDKFDSFRVTCNNYKKKDLVVFPDAKTIQLTTQGWESIDADALASLPKTNQDIHEQMMNDPTQVKGGKVKLMFQFLLDGKPRTKSEIALAAGYTTQDLQTKKDSIRVTMNCLNKLTEKVDNGKIRLSDRVFPFGRPTKEG